MLDVAAAEKYRGKPLGVISITGSPERYSLQPGLTGTAIAQGDSATIIAALAIVLDAPHLIAEFDRIAREAL